MTHHFTREQQRQRRQDERDLEVRALQLLAGDLDFGRTHGTKSDRLQALRDLKPVKALIGKLKQGERNRGRQ